MRLAKKKRRGRNRGGSGEKVCLRRYAGQQSLSLGVPYAKGKLASMETSPPRGGRGRREKHVQGSIDACNGG